MKEEKQAPAKFAALKNATLDLSAACSRSPVSEYELRKGMTELGAILNDMETLWQYVNSNKREVYEKQAESAQIRALKHVKDINPRITSVEEAVSNRVPCREKMTTRSQARSANQSTSQDAEPQEGPSGSETIEEQTVEQNNGESTTTQDSAGAARAEDAQDDGNGSGGPRRKDSKSRKGKSLSKATSESDVEVGKDCEIKGKWQ